MRDERKMTVELFSKEIARALNAVPDEQIETTITGQFALNSVFHVSELALASIHAAASELALLTGARHIALDRQRTECWFSRSVQALGWKLPEAWDPIAGNYEASDGWIRLHTNVPGHLQAALSVLGVPKERYAVAAAVANWSRFDLEQTIVDAGGVAAAMRGIDEWSQHPQGMAVANEPLIAWQEHEGSGLSIPALGPRLDGLRVLDLTRVLAGPVATRFLAGFGADVLRIDPPDWVEESLEPEVTLGKSCACLDLHSADDRRRFEELLSQAHVLVHGYRSSALPNLGYDNRTLRTINPELIDVALCAYGWTGPWKDRRGFDTIVQMNAGFAQEGMIRTTASGPVPEPLPEPIPGPVPLPVQVLDHATGYLMAAAVLNALRTQARTGRGQSARLSLARTAKLLAMAGTQALSSNRQQSASPAMRNEQTHWGAARRIVFPLTLDGREPVWCRQAAPLRSAPPAWSSAVQTG